MQKENYWNYTKTQEKLILYEIYEVFKQTIKQN